jgi:hypothetical protein
MKSRAANNSKSFQEFSNMVENLSATVENLGELSHFTGKQLVKERLLKMPECMRLQWELF